MSRSASPSTTASTGKPPSGCGLARRAHPCVRPRADTRVRPYARPGDSRATARRVAEPSPTPPPRSGGRGAGFVLQSCVQPNRAPGSDLPDGHRVPRFAGINTFARLPHTQDLRDVDVAVVGVPFDGGASFRPGPRFGPQKIREMSVLLRPFNPALGVEPFAEFRVVDWGDAVCSPISMEDSFRAIERAIEAVVSADAFPLVLGGDHSISLPVLRALAKRHGPLGLVHFDAHPDTWDVHFGRKYSHATPFRRAIEEGLDTALSRIREVATGRVYVTLDIDVVDPAFAPGTGTPEVGGLSSRE